MTRIGVVGTGYWGKNLTRNFSELGALAAICDSDTDALNAIGEKYPAADRYADLAALLAQPDIDAIVLSTPAETHGALARQVLNAGKHVFVEKPLCLDPNEGRALKTLSETADKTLMVGHMLLYHPAFQALRKHVDAGEIGDIRYIYSTRLSLGQIRRTENALWSFAPHDISMILSLTGKMPQRVVTNGAAYLQQNVADTTMSHFTFSETLQAHIFVSWLHPFKDHRLVVVGSDGMIVFDDVRTGPEKLLFYKHQVSVADELPTVNRAEGMPIEYADEEPLRRECQHFLDCIAQSRPPASDAAEGIRVLSVLDACQISLNSGTGVELNHDEHNFYP